MKTNFKTFRQNLNGSRFYQFQKRLDRIIDKIDISKGKEVSQRDSFQPMEVNSIGRVWRF